MNQLLLTCKKCNTIRQEITLDEIKDIELKKAFAEIYNGTQIFLHCSTCNETSISFPAMKF